MSDERARSGVVSVAEAAADTEFDVYGLFATDETVTVYLAPASAAHPKGVWVTLKKQLDYGEQVAVEAALIKGLAPDEARQLAQEAEQRGSTIVLDTGRQKLLKLATWIHDWNFPGPAGKTVVWPAKPHERLTVVSSLGGKVGDWLTAQIDKLIADDDAVANADADDEGPDPLGRTLVAVAHEATSQS